MTFESSIPAPPIVQDPGEAVQAAAALIPGPPHPPPTPAEARAAEAVFASEQKEQATVAGLLGMWTGTLLLHDLAHEHLSGPADEDDPPPNRKKKKKTDANVE